MIKKVLLLDTSVGTLNIGDEIINYSIRKNFPEIFSNSYVYNLPTHTPLFNWYQRWLYKNKNIKAYKNADYKFLCGTNALYTNMLRPLPSWNITSFTGDIVNGTICLGVGAGINSSSVNWYTKYLYKKVLNKDFVHSVRDEMTADFLRKMGYKAVNTSCPTMWSLTPELCKNIPSHKGKNVVFTLTSYDPDIKQDKRMITILAKNYENLYFWPQTFEDIAYLHELTDIPINIVPPNLNAYDSILKENIDYVGNRLHGGIFSLQHANRSIIVSIDYRAKNMAKSFNLNIIDRFDIDLLEDMINQECETKIKGIDFGTIDEWKKQFNLCY